MSFVLQRLREPTPRALAPATTVSTPLHGACVDSGGRGGGLAGAGLSRELIAPVMTDADVYADFRDCLLEAAATTKNENGRRSRLKRQRGRL